FPAGSLGLRTAGFFLLLAAGRAGRAGDDGVRLSRHLALADLFDRDLRRRAFCNCPDGSLLRSGLLLPVKHSVTDETPIKTRMTNDPSPCFFRVSSVAMDNHFNAPIGAVPLDC